jgi:hypothetical protein
VLDLDANVDHTGLPCSRKISDRPVLLSSRLLSRLQTIEMRHLGPELISSLLKTGRADRGVLELRTMWHEGDEGAM